MGQIYEGAALIAFFYFASGFIASEVFLGLIRRSRTPLQQAAKMAGMFAVHLTLLDIFIAGGRFEHWLLFAVSGTAIVGLVNGAGSIALGAIARRYAG